MIDEWDKQAVIHGFINDGDRTCSRVHFVATDYAAQKQRYQCGGSLEVVLSGLIFSLAKASCIFENYFTFSANWDGRDPEDLRLSPLSYELYGEVLAISDLSFQDETLAEDESTL